MFESEVDVQFAMQCVDSSIDSGTYDPFSPDAGAAVMPDPEPVYEIDELEWGE